MVQTQLDLTTRAMKVAAALDAAGVATLPAPKGAIAQQADHRRRGEDLQRGHRHEIIAQSQDDHRR